MEILRFSDLHALSLEVARRISSLAREEVKRKGVFNMVLSGGKTPMTLYSILPDLYPPELWSRTHLFWGDERCVPPDHRESNYGMAHRSLLSRITIPEGNIHRMEGEVKPVERAAERYERVLRDHLSDPERRDLILLGMGKDGHVASVFPGGRAIRERKRWVLPVRAPKGAPVEERITLTLPFIETFKKIFLLLSGEEKAGIFSSILEGDKDCPAGMLIASGRVLLFTDIKGI